MAKVEPPSVAYWYPEPLWLDPEAGLVKNLLPFFDQVAILLPQYMYGQHEAANPWLVGPLEERGVLRIVEPETFVDQAVTAQLHAAMRELLTKGAFDNLETSPTGSGYNALSWSRLGWNADVSLASDLVDELVSRKLARSPHDEPWVHLHPVVRTTVLVLLSQLAPEAGRARGMRLLPVTPDRARIRDLLSVLRLPGVASAAEVVAADSETVGLDLSDAALDDVLDFRGLHGSECRRYMRDVRDFVCDVSRLTDDEREATIADRQEALADAAAAITKVSRRYWRRPLAKVAIGGAGAVLSATTGSPLPGVALAGLAALSEWEPKADDTGGAFSYLFEVQRSLVR